MSSICQKEEDFDKAHNVETAPISDVSSVPAQTPTLPHAPSFMPQKQVPKGSFLKWQR